jgi:hypothetical protein
MPKSLGEKRRSTDLAQGSCLHDASLDTWRCRAPSKADELAPRQRSPLDGDVELAVENRVAKGARASRPRERADGGKPEVVEVGERAALEQHATGAIAHERDLDGKALHGAARAGRGMPVDGFLRARLASALDRTPVAQRRPRKADHLAQLHQGLVPIARTAAIEQAGRQRGMWLAARIRSS